MDDFLAGYSAENTLDQAWLKRLPMFLRYRLILLYIVFSNEWAANRNAWQEKQLRSWRQHIVNDTPVVDISLD
jgi:Ser/Thr protein kinase RdoA (MazF antagonist)